MALMTQANFNYIVQKDLSAVFAAEYGDFDTMLPEIYTVKTPDQAIVYELLLGDMGGVSVFDGEVYYDESKQSYRKSVEGVQYSLGVKVTKRLRSNDLYGVVKQQVALIADKFRHKRESIGADYFNNAFSSATVADGQVLCYSGHTSDVIAATQSNAGSSALTPTSLATARLAMIAFKTNNGGTVSGNFPDMLLVPSALEDTALELIKSTLKTGTANNDINVHQGRYKVVVWHNWLSDSNNWFLINSKMMKKYMSFYEWNPTEFFYAGEMDTITSKHAGYMDVNVSTPEWRWVYGSAVS